MNKTIYIFAVALFWITRAFAQEYATFQITGTHQGIGNFINAALLGSDTPPDYVVYNNLVIGGMPSSEAPAAYFKPDIPLKSLTFIFENLQENYNTSYHFYIASLAATGIDETGQYNFVIHPNPTRGKFQITSTKFQTESKFQAPNPKHQTNSKIQIQNIEVVDLYGKVIKEVVCDLNFGACLVLGACNLEFDITRCPPGIYFIRISLENQTIVKKVIKL